MRSKTQGITCWNESERAQWGDWKGIRAGSWEDCVLYPEIQSHCTKDAMWDDFKRVVPVLHVLGRWVGTETGRPLS